MKSALLVIDAQKIYSLEDSSYFVEENKLVVKNINRLINSFQKNDDLVIYVRHEHIPDGTDSGRMFDFAGDTEEVEFQRGSIEAEFIDELLLEKRAIIVTKNRYDAFLGTGLDELLKKNRIEKVVICGFMTNFCCESTARHAHDIDYYVDFVADAVGTPGTEQLSPEETTRATIATLEAGFAVIVNTDDIVFT